MSRIKFVVVFFASLLISISIVFPNRASSQESSPYLIGATDVLNIYVWKEPDLTQDVTVLPDGKITFPLIGEIQAQGRTVTELKKDISDKLKDYVTAPEVTIVVREVNSRRIYTLGKLTSPGIYPLVPGMTVLQALSTAGGFTEWASKKEIILLRNENGKEKIIRVNYKKIVKGEDFRQNVKLKADDTIIVP